MCQNDVKLQYQTKNIHKYTYILNHNRKHCFDTC